MREHTKHECSEDCDDFNCKFCVGGLFLCTVCGGAESSLTTDCPGEKMTEDQHIGVSLGKLDFINGKWSEIKLKKVCFNCQNYDIDYDTGYVECYMADSEEMSEDFIKKYFSNNEEGCPYFEEVF